MDRAAPDLEPPRPGQADPAGRDRLTRNVLSSWGAYLLIAVTGFIMPRLLDRSIGQTALGIWDFGWSLVSYFRLAQIGVGPSVNRYVAKHRAVDDVVRLRRVVSSVTCINVIAAAAVLLLTAAAAWLVPALLSGRSPEHAPVARWVVAFLGASLAVELAFDVFAGVITGCHRWDLHNVINTTFHVGIIAAFVTGLSLGGGLRSLAVINFCGVVLTELTRAVVAYRVCPGLRIRLADARLAEARRMIAFGMKSSVAGLARLLLFQGNSLIVASSLGPGALAVLARPMALIRMVETFANKFAFVLTPTASSLQSSGRHAEVRDLVLKTGRLGAALALPLLLVLAILGDPILRLWMGGRYERGVVLAILALGCTLPFAQRPMGTILIGLNRHGPLALANLAAAVVGVSLGLLNAFWLHGGLPGAAAAIGLPFTCGPGLFLAVYGCRRVGIRLPEYLRRVLLPPLACALPFAAVLVGCRVAFADRPLLALGVGLLGGTVILLPLYWCYLVPESLRGRVASAAAVMLGAVRLRPR